MISPVVVLPSVSQMRTHPFVSLDRIIEDNTIIKEYDVLHIFQSALSFNDLKFSLPYDNVGTVIPDGVYQIQYKVSTNPNATWNFMDLNTSSLYVGYFATWFVIQIVVFKRIALIPEHTKFKAIGDNFTRETSLIYSLLNALIASAQYSNFTTFTSILDTLLQILSFDTTWQIRKQ